MGGPGSGCALRFEPEVSHADWFARSGEPWTQLCSIGPSRFSRYARLFHPLRPGADPDDPDELVNLEGDLASEVLLRLLRVLERHTTTPQDCYFCLWEGFGDIHGGLSVGLLYATDDPPRADGQPPVVPPAFPPEVINGPRVRMPARDYLLFRGPLHEAGQWGAADLLPGVVRPINSPNLMWPADHAWFVATEIDLPWTGIGGSTELIETLMADESFDIEQVEPSAAPAYWRNGVDP